ncbi:hypothetical protein Ade02nite_37450 [Paractinoplanes deccanensis]|uniref:Uncharacterized protein n=1 Tax=Paractinoplanes deccanensis TaxID=113561 RepID=A0ABQ3Y543_9ACTN|nr:hypothetical protein Ade02nite_37450 [Actinoplanes deccanensis]
MAAGWAALYGTVALVWTLTGRGFPFGPGHQDEQTAVLARLGPDTGAPLFAALLLTGAVALLIMADTSRPPRWARFALLGYVWLLVAGLLVVVPDMRLLVLTGYAPILIIGFPFGFPPVDYSEIFTWTLANQVFAVAGGLLLARAALRWQFRTAGACEDCGRRPGGASWTSAESAARWGRWATYIAAAIPLFYAVVRLAWAAGIPLGISPDFLDEMRENGAVWGALGLGGFAAAGAILTLGLTQRWGEVFPRWMVGLAGRRVPIRMATVPATLVSIFVMSASVAFFADPEGLEMITGNGLAAAPMATWPFWSLALGAATLGYHLRRRPACQECRAPGLVPARAAGAY